MEPIFVATLDSTNKLYREWLIVCYTSEKRISRSYMKKGEIRGNGIRRSAALDVQVGIIGAIVALDIFWIKDITYL